MQTVKEFGGSTATMSLREFWRTAGPAVAVILVLALVMALWKRLISKPLRRQIRWTLLIPFYKVKYHTMRIMGGLERLARKRLPRSREYKVSDLETPNSEQAATRPSLQEQALAGLPPSHPGEGTERSTI